MGRTVLTKKRATKKQVAGLTDKERLFAMEYRVDRNSTEAAIRAGYTGKHAASLGCKLLKKPAIATLISKQDSSLAKRVELRIEEVITQLYYLCTRRADDFVGENGEIKPIKEMSDRAQACIDGIEQTVYVSRDKDGEETGREVKTKLRLSPKATAIDMAMKHKGAYTPEKHEVEVNVKFDFSDLYGEPPVPTNVIDVEALEKHIMERDKPDVPVKYTVNELLEEGEME